MCSLQSFTSFIPSAWHRVLLPWFQVCLPLIYLAQEPKVKIFSFSCSLLKLISSGEKKNVKHLVRFPYHRFKMQSLFNSDCAIMASGQSGIKHGAAGSLTCFPWVYYRFHPLVPCLQHYCLCLDRLLFRLLSVASSRQREFCSIQRPMWILCHIADLLWYHIVTIFFLVKNAITRNYFISIIPIPFVLLMVFRLFLVSLSLR